MNGLKHGSVCETESVELLLCHGSQKLLIARGEGARPTQCSVDLS